MWFATDHGAVRYDGEVFRTFNRSGGLPDQVVFGFHQDATSAVWFRTFSGRIATYANDAISPYPFNDSLRHIMGGSLLSAIVRDSIGQLWIGTSGGGGIYKVDSSGHMEAFTQPTNTLFIQSIDGANCVVGYTGRASDIKSMQVNGKAFPIRIADKAQHNTVLNHTFWNGDLYVAINRNIFRYNGASVENVFVSDYPIISLGLDSDNTLWVGYLNRGVHRFTTPDFHDPQNLDALRNRSVSGIAQDTEGGYWFSTLDKGVYYFPNLNVANYNFPTDAKISSVAWDDKMVFTGDYLGNVSAIDQRTKRLVWSRNFSHNVLSLHTAKGSLWVSTVAGTIVTDTHGRPQRSYPDIKGVKDFFRDDNGFTWAVSRFFVYKLDGRGNVRLRKQIGFWGRHIYVEKARVFIAGVTGLYAADTLLEKTNEIPMLHEYKVSDITTIDRDHLLIATAGNGLFHLKNERVKALTAFVVQNIYAFIKTPSALWMASEKGLLKTDVNALRQGHVRYDYVSKASGLIHDKINFIAPAQGEWWALAEAGYSVVPEGKTVFANRDPLFYFSAFKVNDRPVDPLRSNRFRFNENNIKLTFGFISFNNRDIRVKHKLNTGRDDVWNSAGRNQIEFYSLSPQNYTVDVAYSVDNVQWKNATFPNRFTILPPWWETRWFLIFLVIASCVPIGLFFYFRMKSFQQKKLKEFELQLKLRLQRERIALELHDNIGAQLTSVSLGLNRLIREVDRPALTQPLQEGLDLTMIQLRDTIWAMNKDVISMDELEQKVLNMLWQFSSNLKAALRVEVDPALSSLTFNPTQTVNLFRIVQECVHNSIKHSSATEIKVTFRRRGDTVQLEITDNGGGFNVHNNIDEDSYGLRNMRRRADDIGAAFSLDSTPGKGTTVQVNFPIR